MEKQMRYLYLIICNIILFSLFSCRTTQNIAGTYICENNSIYNYHKVILKEDGNCMLISRDFMFPDTTFVKWELEKNNRYFILKPENSYYVLSTCDTCVSYKITVLEEQTKEKMMYAHIQIYHDSTQIDEYITDSTGSIVLKQNTFDSIKINYLGYAEAIIEYYSGINNIDVLLVKKKYLSKEKWKIISNKKIKLIKCCTYIKQN